MSTIAAADTSVPEFTGKAADTINEFYGKAQVASKGVAAKIAALEANLGRFEFSAYGGDETSEMKLRAAERVYLLKRGIEPE